MANPRPKPDTGYRDANLSPGKPKATALPPPPPPPPAQTKASSTGAAFNSFINAHPIMRDYADLIWKWADKYGVDKVVAAALFWRESFAAAKARGKDPRTIVSPAGAVGIGQIMPLHVGEKTPWGHIVSQTDLTNPQFNIRWSMWYFSKQQEKYGDADSAYNQGYNPGYSGAALTSLLPKGYVPRGGLTPTETGQAAAETAAATAAAKTVLNDKWAVLTDKGKLAFVTIKDPAAPPANVLKYGPSPLTQSQFIQVWKQTYQDTFFAYTGRQASGKEIAGILKNAPSVYTLANALVGTNDFVKSPTYKAHAPGIIQYAKSILGTAPDAGLVKKAIAQNWDQATLYANIKKLPSYQTGPEFQDNLAKSTNVFQQIYGSKADAATSQMIHDKTLAGWTPDQLALWLRSQPAYQQSPEYESKALSFGTALGLITGHQPVLKPVPQITVGGLSGNGLAVSDG